MNFSLTESTEISEKMVSLSEAQRARAKRARDNMKAKMFSLAESTEIAERVTKYQESVGLILGILKSDQRIIL